MDWPAPRRLRAGTPTRAAATAPHRYRNSAPARTRNTTATTPLQLPHHLYAIDPVDLPLLLLLCTVDGVLATLLLPVVTGISSTRVVVGDYRKNSDSLA